MTFQCEFADESISALYENIRQQVEADRKSEYRFTDGEAVRQHAEELRNEMIKRRLNAAPLIW